MKKVLILPLLKIPTGHHHVAGSLKAQIAGKVPGSVEVVDILSESYGFLERLISLLYLFSIKKFPNLYSRLYHVFAVKEGKAKKAYLLYDWLFLRKMEMLLKTRDPDLVICTHAFPSYLIGRLKRKNRWNGRVINVYTDFFINRLWSVAEIDYHFAPSRPLNPGSPPGPRVVIDHVQVSTFGLDATVEVRLAAGDRPAAGLATGPAVDGYVLRLCAVAAAAAIDELLSSSSRVTERGRCFVEHAAVVPFGSCEVATVVVLLVCDGWVEQLAGSALVAGDPRQAVVRATLAAVNRRLEALLA